MFSSYGQNTALSPEKAEKSGKENIAVLGHLRGQKKIDGQRDIHSWTCQETDKTTKKTVERRNFTHHEF